MGSYDHYIHPQIILRREVKQCLDMIGESGQSYNRKVVELIFIAHSGNNDILSWVNQYK